MVRVKVLNKLENAIALVVTRGADVEEGEEGENGVKRIVFRDKEGGSGWMLRGACMLALSSLGARTLALC